MTVFVLGMLAGALVGAQFTRRVDGFRGARSVVAKTVGLLTDARSKEAGARNQMIRFLVVLAVGVVVVAYGWSRQP